jgi:hypothetical protein
MNKYHKNENNRHLYFHYHTKTMPAGDRGLWYGVLLTARQANDILNYTINEYGDIEDGYDEDLELHLNKLGFVGHIINMDSTKWTPDKVCFVYGFELAKCGVFESMSTPPAHPNMINHVKRFSQKYNLTLIGYHSFYYGG